MGIDTKRFVNPLPPDFICPICNDVFDAPVQCPEEHIFCNECISKWMLKINRCPLDQKTLSSTELTPSPRVLRNLIDNLEIRCKFSEYGCHNITTLESMERHAAACEFRSVMERRTEELNLLREQINELMNDVTAMRNNATLLNDDLMDLIEANQKLETATVAIDDLQTQIDSKNCQLSQLETKFDKLEATNKAELEKQGLELTKIYKLIGNLSASHQSFVNRESANRKQIAEVTEEITVSLAKLTTLNN